MELVVDIRKEKEYLKKHCAKSLRISPSELYQDSLGLKSLKNMKPTEIVIMGDDIKSAEEFRSFLSSLSWQPKVKVYEGGMDAWIASGKPYLSQPSIISKIREQLPRLFAG